MDAAFRALREIERHGQRERESVMARNRHHIKAGENVYGTINGFEAVDLFLLLHSCTTRSLL